MCSLPTNVLSILVFAKQGLKERINLCLFCLSFNDLVYMIANVNLYSDRSEFK
jgi:hypothetical protein